MGFWNRMTVFPSKQLAATQSLICIVFLMFLMVSPPRSTIPYTNCHSAHVENNFKMFVHLLSLHAIRSASKYKHQICRRPIVLLLCCVRFQRNCSWEEDFWRTKAKNWINDVKSGEERQSSQLEKPSGSLFSWIPISPGWRWYFCPGSQLSLFAVWWWRLIDLAKFHRLLGRFNPRWAVRELLCRWLIRENFLWHSVFLYEKEMTDVWSS